MSEDNTTQITEADLYNRLLLQTKDNLIAQANRLAAEAMARESLLAVKLQSVEAELRTLRTMVLKSDKDKKKESSFSDAETALIDRAADAALKSLNGVEKQQ